MYIYRILQAAYGGNFCKVGCGALFSTNQIALMAGITHPERI